MLDELRAACKIVAARARSVRIREESLGSYAQSLDPNPPDDAAVAEPSEASAEQRAAFWLTLDAINFGSGWFPTVRKRPGHSGYHTIAAGMRERFASLGAWSARQLSTIERAELAAALGQDPDHELIGLFTRSLRDLGAHIEHEYGGSFIAPLTAAGSSCAALVEVLARWECFADSSCYGGVKVPFLKRAQIAAADLARAQLARFDDLDRLTMFADNLVPHVLRVDGLLEYDEELGRRIERGELIEHGSPEEVEIRACALHAVEMIVAARGDTCAAVVDQVLWRRGGQPRYKSIPRHRSRCTAY